MVAAATRKAKRRKLNCPVEFFSGDALALPFPDNSFACVTSGFSLRNVIDLPRALAEMARVVRQGGRVVSLEITPMQRNGPFARLFRLYFHRLVPLVGGLLARDREAYTYLPRSVDLFPSADTLAELMEQAGLQSVTYKKVGLGTVAIHVGEKE
jgi:demethylmenaquinone methyltransferase/2-methoxy-6-polyprenyl-1,4-benzoquinol methylase